MHPHVAEILPETLLEKIPCRLRQRLSPPTAQAIDLRLDSPTHGRWTGHELSAANRRALYIPEGCAHGLLTLEDETEVSYLMGAAYDSQLARGVRWNDPAFAIEWPFAPLVISQRDAKFADYAL